MNKFTKQCVAAFASLAMAGTLCVAGAVVTNNVAFATDSTAASTDPAPWDQAAANKTGSITITKYKDETNDQGKQTQKTKVEGAKFKVTPVSKIDGTAIDLKKYDDWLKVAAKVPSLNLNPSSLPSTDLGTAVTNPNPAQGETDNTLFATGSDGKVTVNNLQIGLYKVEEVSVPDGYEKLPQPFFMTIPEITSGKKGTEYDYKPTVDPKNAYTKDAIKKTVDTTGMVGTKDDLPYTISTSVVTNSGTPVKNRTADDYQGFAVWDDALISAYDGMDNLDNTAAKKMISNVKIGTTPINNAADQEDKYSVSVESHSDSDKNSPEAGRKRIKITFKDGATGGLNDIATALKTSPNAKLTFDIKFTLSKNVAAGELVNKYGYQPGYKKDTPDKDKPKPVNPDPGSESKVTLVQFKIKKISSTDGKAIKGAKFAVFAKSDDAKACATDASRTDANCKDKSSKGFDTQTETAETTGLTKDGFKAKVGQKFYVVETKAPDKYVLAPKVEEVTIPTEYTKDTNYDSKSQTFIYSFKDVPTSDNGIDHWFKLPKTGAYGVIIFALVGMCLVAVGIFVFMRNRRKDEEQQAA